MDRSGLYSGINIHCERQTNVVRWLQHQQKCALTSAAEECREKAAATHPGGGAGK